jgi:hypothetical protein
MGAQPSRPSRDAYTEKEAVERMRQLAISTPEENGNEKQRSKYVPDETSSLSIGDVGKWQQKLMDDPKNRYALHVVLHATLRHGVMVHTWLTEL